MDVSISELHEADLVYPDKPYVSSIWKSLVDAMESGGLEGKRVAVLVQGDGEGCLSSGLIIAKKNGMTCDDLPPHMVCVMVEPGMSTQDVMLRLLLELSEQVMHFTAQVKSGRIMVLPVGDPGERD